MHWYFSALRKQCYTSLAVNAPCLFVVYTVSPSASGWCLRQMALETDAISQGSAPFWSNHWCSMWPVYACACVNACIHARQLSMCAECVSEFNPSTPVKNCLLHRHGSVCLFVCLYTCVCVCVCMGLVCSKTSHPAAVRQMTMFYPITH